ncbi:hypothetical protein PC117_g7614 [Phytophthora cactorum]|uniref:Uncharacterized protein n=1 Tax=Phytophthora cactorum TaxID=29920 RepID=A0A8T1DXQ9_9STRA|nr:hypothetical protein PC117_g7614 [Phytophthora cactorum]
MASFIRILISLRQDLIAAPAADVAMLNSIAEFAVSSWSQIADAHCQVFQPQTGSSQVLRRRSSCSSGRVFQEDDPFHPQQTRRWDSELGIQLAAELSSLVISAVCISLLQISQILQDQRSALGNRIHYSIEFP